MHKLCSTIRPGLFRQCCETWQNARMHIQDNVILAIKLSSTNTLLILRMASAWSSRAIRIHLESPADVHALSVECPIVLDGRYQPAAVHGTIPSRLVGQVNLYQLKTCILQDAYGQCFRQPLHSCCAVAARGFKLPGSQRTFSSRVSHTLSA